MNEENNIMETQKQPIRKNTTTGIYKDDLELLKEMSEKERRPLIIVLSEALKLYEINFFAERKIAS